MANERKFEAVQGGKREPKVIQFELGPDTKQFFAAVIREVAREVVRETIQQLGPRRRSTR